MKICVFSDSHGSAGNMLRAIEEHSPDMILHLGDGERDTEKIRSRFPQIPLKGVKGNCDLYSFLSETELLEIRGVRFMLTHGHLYGVKNGLSRLVAAAKDAGADVVLYGHTHTAFYDMDGPLHILNPGSCMTHSGSFAIVDLTAGGSVSCRILGF